MAKKTFAKPVPRYQQIKTDLLARIAAGEWAVGTAIPPEETLAREFAVARMTVNRALRELTDAGALRRVQGSGTFVAPLQVEASLVEIRSIADEITERGHRHSSRLQHLGSENADAEMAALFGLKRTAPVFHSLLVHCEEGQPIQVEERWVNPQLAADYLTQDFRVLTPSAYLSSVAPLTGARYTVEARLPTQQIADLLSISPGSPCLVVCRTTLSGERVASLALLWHCGERYRLYGSI